MANPDEKLVLKPGVVLQFLSDFGMSNDGESFIMKTCDMSQRNLEQVNKVIDEAKEVYNMNLSFNKVGDASALSVCYNLQRCELQTNNIKNITAWCSEENFSKLRYLDVSNNKIAEMPTIACPQLEYLDLSLNKLDKVSEGWQGHPNLKVLKAVECKVKNISIFKNMPKLEELWASNNAIGSLVGLDGCGALKKLHLRHNKIEKIEEEGLPSIETLEYLNLRTNKIPDLDNLFRLFGAFPAVKQMNFLNCPVELNYSSMNVFIADALARKPDITRFCKVDVQDKNRNEAVFVAKYKWTKAQEKAKAEAAAAALAEQQQNA